MIEITEAAANMIKQSLVEGKVLKMFLAGIDGSGATYGLGLGEAEEGDQVFESRGVKVYMSAKDAELLGETIIDYIDDEEMGKGFIIRGPEDEVDGCSSCANAATCDHDHDHDSCDHDHGHDGCGCGCS
ncbi:MAG: adhesin [Methanothrix sp.]|nr:adhesin [Methanothrix sp.]